jgi:Flp pilus assembly protein CpaB
MRGAGRPTALRRQRPSLRRLLSAGLACLAVAVALRVLAPTPAAQTPVLVAAHDLPAGHQLGPDDLSVSGWRPGSGPSGRLSAPGPAVGRVTSGPVQRGSPVTEADLLGTGVLTGQPPDLLAVAVPVADGSLTRLVRRGDRVDVLAAATSSAVVSDAVVLAEPGAADPVTGLSSGFGGAGAGTGSAGGAGGSIGGGAGLDPGGGSSVVLGVRLWDAERLAHAEASGALTLAVHPR